MAQADLLLVVARTSPLDEQDRTREITMFLVSRDEHNVNIKVSPLDKLGLNYMDTSCVYINKIRIPDNAVFGAVNGNWLSIFDLLNPERMTVSVGCICG